VYSLLDGCRTLLSSEETQDCKFYQVTLRGSYIGNGKSSDNPTIDSAAAAATTAQDLQDLVNFLELTVDSTALTEDLNDDLYETKFDGVPVADDTNSGGDAARDNLNEALNDGTDSVIAGQQAQSNDTDRTTITIVGGLLVAAFAAAFFGICFILWRRRQYFIRSRQVHMHQWENDHQDGGAGLDQDGDKQFMYDDENGDGPGVVEKGSGLGDLQRYSTSNTDEDEKDDEYGDETMDGQQKRTSDGITKNRSGEDMDASQSSHEDVANGGAMQFDLGTSFKDQLMGVHGSRGGNNLNIPVGAASNSSKRGSQLGSLFPATHSLDGDSDADSWAQTDGTIGSLEIGLEPLTAEI
jgi:hypothetical protein